MKIIRKDLLKALEAVKPALSNKDMIEQSTHFAFLGNKVVAYNDVISISHPLKDLDFEGAVKAEQLYQLITKIHKEEVEIEITKKELLIKSGRSKAGIAIQKEILLPYEEIGDIGKFKSISPQFLEGLSFAMSCTSKDMSNAKLTCVYINEEGRIQGCDNYRAVSYKTEVPIKTILIPATSIPAILQMDPNKIAHGKGWVHFKNEQNAIISARVYHDEKYTDLTSILKNNGKEIKFPKSLENGIDKARIFNKNKVEYEEIITITIKKQKLTVFSNSEFGWYKEPIPIKYTGEPISFTIPCYVLLSILQKTHIATISKTKLSFSGKNWMYVTAIKNI